MKKTLAEAESTLFWQIANDIETAAREERPLDEHVDEIEAILRHTDQPAIRQRCVSLLMRFAPQSEVLTAKI